MRPEDKQIPTVSSVTSLAEIRIKFVNSPCKLNSWSIRHLNLTFWFCNFKPLSDRPLKSSILQECDIIAATEKLAACQETILNLGKQLKALASADDEPLFSNVSTSPNSNHHRLQLLEHMRKEGHSESGELRSKKENVSTEPSHPSVSDEVQMSPENLSDKHKRDPDEGKLMIVAKKQDAGASLLRKILMQRRRKSSTRLELPMGAQ